MNDPTKKKYSTKCLFCDQVYNRRVARLKIYLTGVSSGKKNVAKSIYKSLVSDTYGLEEVIYTVC